MPARPANPSETKLKTDPHGMFSLANAFETTAAPATKMPKLDKLAHGITARYAKSLSSFVVSVQIRCLALWLAIS